MFYNAHFLKCTIMPEIVTGAATLGGAGIGALTSGIDYNRQKKLMDKSYQQQVALWMMQNAYMSPKNQMQRFVDAGLNPDLIYNKMGDTTGSVPSVGTPQVSPMSQAVTQGALAGSQINLQESLTRKNNAETKSIDAQTSFYLESFDTRMNLLTGDLKLKGFQADWVKTMTDYQKESFSMLHAQTEYWKSLSYEQAYRGLVAEKDYETYDARFSNFMNETKSRTRLNNSSALKIERDARFLIETWADRKLSISLQNDTERSRSALNRAMAGYYNTENDYILQKTLYMPLEFIDEITRGQTVFETNEDGSIKTNKDGIPQVNSTYAGVELGLEIGGEVMSIIGDVVGMILPWKFLKSGFSVGGAKTATNSAMKGHVPSTKPVRHSTNGFQPSKEYMDLVNKYKNAAPGSAEKQRLYRKLMNYPK